MKGAGWTSGLPSKSSTPIGLNAREEKKEDRLKSDAAVQRLSSCTCLLYSILSRCFRCCRNLPFPLFTDFVFNIVVTLSTFMTTGDGTARSLLKSFLGSSKTPLGQRRKSDAKAHLPASD